MRRGSGTFRTQNRDRGDRGRARLPDRIPDSHAPGGVRDFEAFIELLDDMSFIRWVPLRAEPSPRDLRPVSVEETRILLGKIAKARSRPRWADLRLLLSVPFCVLDNPADATALLEGRGGCGPNASVAINPRGEAMRCYSRRSPLAPPGTLRSRALRAAREDYRGLPALCHICPVGALCQGGCRCPGAKDQSGFDYLARPETARMWIKDKILLKTILEISG